MNHFKLDKERGYGSFIVHDNVIPGSKVLVHYLSENSHFNFEQSDDFIRLLFLSEGKVRVLNTDTVLPTRTTFIPRTDVDTCLSILDTTVMLEIRIYLTRDELAEVSSKLPLRFAYDDSLQYSESCKSIKTINRMIISDGTLPRFAMGSVETIGPDKVSDDCHPEVDQFFFTLPENQSELFIDGGTVYLGGNSVIHIPLGAVHGSNIPSACHMHYLWCDFMISEESHAYMSSAHVYNNEKRSFNG